MSSSNNRRTSATRSGGRGKQELDQSSESDSNAYNVGINANNTRDDDSIDGTATTTALLFVDDPGQYDDSSEYSEDDVESDEVNYSCSSESDEDLEPEDPFDDRKSYFNSVLFCITLILFVL